MKKLFLFIVIVAFAKITFAQDVTCGQITIVRNAKGQQTSFYRVDNSNIKWMGICYNRIRPYIICTPVAQPVFEKAVKCSRTGFVLIGAAVAVTAAAVLGYDMQILGFPPSVADKVPLVTVGTGLGLVSGVFFIAGRICLNLSILKHNQNLTTKIQ